MIKVFFAQLLQHLKCVLKQPCTGATLKQSSNSTGQTGNPDTFLSSGFKFEKMCRCKSGCGNRRCSCRKVNKRCVSCRCTNCTNKSEEEEQETADEMLEDSDTEFPGEQHEEEEFGQILQKLRAMRLNASQIEELQGVVTEKLAGAGEMGSLYAYRVPFYKVKVRGGGDWVVVKIGRTTEKPLRTRLQLEQAHFTRLTEINPGLPSTGATTHTEEWISAVKNEMVTSNKWPNILWLQSGMALREQEVRSRFGLCLSDFKVDELRKAKLSLSSKCFWANGD